MPLKRNSLFQHIESAAMLKDRAVEERKSIGLHKTVFMAKDNFIKEKKEVVGKDTVTHRRRLQATARHPQQSSVSG